ncbi:hypothetical protein BH10ACT6_BH10ACT6_11290 [soil metagenome]
MSTLSVSTMSMSTRSMSTRSHGGFTAASSPATHLHITKRGRAVVAFLVAVPLAVAAAVFGAGAVGAVAGSGGGAATSFHYVTVDPGQSLWQLAETIAPNADPRDVVADVVTLNNLPSGDVQPGQRLAIPAKYEP